MEFVFRNALRLLKGLNTVKSEEQSSLNMETHLDRINCEVNFQPSLQSGVLETVVVPV